MKLLKATGAAALLTTILGVTPILADELPSGDTNGQVRSTNTNGQIEFIPSNEDTIVIPPVEDGPGVEIPAIPGPEGESNTGPLTIAYVPALDFGQQEITNEDARYPVIASLYQVVGAEEGVVAPVRAFAQVQDTRGTNAGWDLSVSLTNFTSNTQNNVLFGAQISFENSTLEHVGNDANQPDFINNSFVLNPNTGATRIMAAAEGRGAGASSIVWGNEANLLDQHENGEVVTNDAIQLFIPGSTSTDATAYVADLNWILTAGVENTN